MPDNVLDYAQRHPKPQKVLADRTPRRDTRGFRTISLILAFSLLAFPIGTLTQPLFDHSYGLIGAAVFVVGASWLFARHPSKSKRRPLIAVITASIAITAFLHVFSTNVFVFENASGQPIKEIALGVTGGRPGYLQLVNVPASTVTRIRVHDLFHGASVELLWGNLADGTAINNCRSITTTSNRTATIRIGPNGNADITWP